MSMDRCNLCSDPVDTDEDTDCYFVAGQQGNCVCERCRENETPLQRKEAMP